MLVRKCVIPKTARSLQRGEGSLAWNANEPASRQSHFTVTVRTAERWAPAYLTFPRHASTTIQRCDMLRRLCIACVCLAASLNAVSQTAPASSPGVDRIRTASRAAANDLSWRVQRLRSCAFHPQRPNQLDVVQVQFHVDEGLRGATTGSTLRIREWAGLWTSNDRSTASANTSHYFSTRRAVSGARHQSGRGRYGTLPW